jgi:hypothetical protein
MLECRARLLLPRASTNQLRHGGLLSPQLPRVIVWHHEALPSAGVCNRRNVKPGLHQIVRGADPRGVAGNAGDPQAAGVDPLRQAFEDSRHLIVVSVESAKNHDLLTRVASFDLRRMRVKKPQSRPVDQCVELHRRLCHFRALARVSALLFFSELWP